MKIHFDNVWNLDGKNEIILSKNDVCFEVSTASKEKSPHINIRNFDIFIASGNFKRKIKVSIIALKFIWLNNK
jgi:hypothetical protein